MAKKAELLEKAAELKLDVTEKNTIAEIEAAIEGAAKADAKEAEQTNISCDRGRRHVGRNYLRNDDTRKTRSDNSCKQTMAQDKRG